MTDQSPPFFGGQSVADALEQIRDDLTDKLDKLDKLEPELVDWFRGRPYDVRAEVNAIIDAIDTLQLLLFQGDPPAFLQVSVK